jgi:hypothetical protein
MWFNRLTQQLFDLRLCRIDCQTRFARVEDQEYIFA